MKDSSPIAASERDPTVRWGPFNWDAQLARRYNDRMLLVVGVMSVLQLLAFAFSMSDQPLRLLGAGSMLAMVLLTWVVSRQFGVIAAMPLWLVGSWCAVTLMCLFGGGPQAGGVVGYAFMVIVAGWVYDRKAAWAVAGVSCAALFAMAWITQQPWFGASATTPIYVSAAVQSAVCMVAAALVSFVIHGYRRQLVQLYAANAEATEQSRAIEDGRRRLLMVAETVKLQFWTYDPRADVVTLGSFLPDPKTGQMTGNSIRRTDMLRWVHPADLPRVQWRSEAGITGHESSEYDIEFRVMSKRRPGEWNWIHLRSAVAERTPEGELISAMGMLVDITDRKRTELALHEQRQRFEKVFDDHPDVLLIVNYLNGQVVAANHATTVLTGLEGDALIGQEVLKLALWMEPEVAPQMVEHIAQSAKFTDLPTRLRRPDGQVMHALVSGAMSMFGEEPHIIITVRDVTAQHLAEQQRQLSELLLKGTLNSVVEAVIVLNERNETIFANPQYFKIWNMPESMGLTENQVQAYAHVSAMLDVADVNAYWVGVAEVSQRSEPYQDVVKFKDGRVIERYTLPLQLGNVLGRLWSFRDITELTRAHQTVSERNSFLRALFDGIPLPIYHKDAQGRYQGFNRAYREFFGGEATTSRRMGRTIRELASSDIGTLHERKDRELYEKGAVAPYEVRDSAPDGTQRELMVHKSLIKDDAGHVLGTLGAIVDMTGQKAADEMLRLTSLVLENSNESVLFTDAQHRIVGANPALLRNTGYELEEIVGRTPVMFRGDRHPPEFYDEMANTLKSAGRWQGEVWRRRKNGEVYVEWTSVSVIHKADGTVHRHVALSTDITERKKSEELIWSHAYLDSLTQLPNRRMFHDRLQQAIKNAERSGDMLALLFIDLDHFKEVNDTEGHEKGDMLLVEAARRISASVRSADTVARLGGDEFTVILTDLQSDGAVERVASQIIELIKQPFTLENKEAYVSASIGITVYPHDGNTVEDLLRSADQAMYDAKNQGRNRYRYFTPAMQEAAQEKHHLVTDLRRALDLNQFEVYFQPLVDLRTGRVNKAEGLIRWHHPVRGMVSPATFIPLAESSGLIHAIGEWVFGSVAQHLTRWRSMYGDTFQISLNMSPIQVRESDCGKRWPDLIRQLQLSGHNLLVEITEGLLIDDSDQVKSQLLAFRDAGIHVAIDDFGTGYSALSYLNKLDIDVLKIDRSFIRHIGMDMSELALVEAMVVMAHKLGLKVVAEGVETEQQNDILRGMGCDFAQGYFHAKPLPVAEFEAWMQHRMGPVPQPSTSR